MSGLADRIIRALEVLGSDEQITGTLRHQASIYLGDDVDDLTLKYLLHTAESLYESGRDSSLSAEPDNDDGAHDVGLMMVAVASMAIGKRLGIEDGEQFARGVPSVD